MSNRQIAAMIARRRAGQSNKPARAAKPARGNTLLAACVGAAGYDLVRTY